MMRLLTALVFGFCLAACSSPAAPSATTPARLAIAPSSPTVQTSSVLQFNLLGGQGFAWSVAGTGCSGASCGTIDATGRYTAPATVPDPAIVTVTARSVVDSTKSLEATVTIIPSQSFSMTVTSVLFGNQMVQTTSAPRAVTLTNTGSSPQPVHGRINGEPGQWQNFAFTNDCPSMHSVGGSCTFNITFTPRATGRWAATLNVDGIFDEEGSVNLTGTGTPD